jgi:hypothetical protein
MGAIRQCCRLAPERAKIGVCERGKETEAKTGKETGHKEVRLATMPTVLQSWSGRKSFRYEFSRSTLDVQIFCGKKFSRKYRVDGACLRAVLLKFSGKDSPAGTNRTQPPPDSIGDWLRVHCKRGGIMSYLGPILIEEGYAKLGLGTDRIYVNPFRP